MLFSLKDSRRSPPATGTAGKENGGGTDSAEAVAATPGRDGCVQETGMVGKGAGSLAKCGTHDIMKMVVSD